MENENEERAHVHNQNQISSTTRNDSILKVKPLTEQNEMNNAKKSVNSSMVGKENSPPSVELNPKPKNVNREITTSAQTCTEISQNQFDHNESSSSDITFEPNNVPLPMNSKIRFDDHESTDDLPMFSPPKKAKTTKVPDFIRVLEPTVYNQIQKQSTGLDQTQTPSNKNPKEDEEQVAQSIVKHTLNTNHLYFPGKCSFVSSIQLVPIHIYVIVIENISFFYFHRETVYSSSPNITLN